MKKILNIGGGVQTTALAILVVEGKVKADMVIFSDTGSERPETYWYLENYTGPLLKDAGIPFHIVRNEMPSCQPDLYGWLWRLQQIPSIGGIRTCSIKFKRETIERWLKKQGVTEYQAMLGFSTDEVGRASRPEHNYPLIELGLSVTDCRMIISDYGWPLVLKSSCYFCPFQHVTEWQWLKRRHLDLFYKSLALEARYHDRHPNMLDCGLVYGIPLRLMREGIQPEMFGGENSCWDGACGH